MIAQVLRSYADSLGFDLAEAVDTFRQAVDDHRLTVDVPAPTAHPLVEAIVREYGGRFEIVADPEPEVPPAEEMDPVDPVEKLAAFLKANPDVKGLLG